MFAIYTYLIYKEVLVMYENIINRIIEAEDNAQDEISKAMMKSNDIISEAEKEAEEIKKSALDRAEKRMDKIEYVEQQASQYVINEAKKRHDETIAGYEKFYDEQHEKIEDEIFSRIIGE